MSRAVSLDQPLGALARALRAGRVTSVELTREALRRLEGPGRALNAVVNTLPRRALREARECDRQLARGVDNGPLQGIPYGLKDVIAATGAPTTWGVAAFKERILPADAEVTRRLTEAGAVLVAKLATIQLAGGFGYYHGSASLRGPTRNPWDVRRWSGGSSSGPAAAVAAGLVPFAVGTDTWGSILVPAAWCGVTAVRPSFGRVSRGGVLALAWSMDRVGPFARSATDAFAVLRVISGPDDADLSTRDPLSAPSPKRRRARIAAFLPGYLRQDIELWQAHSSLLSSLDEVADVRPIPGSQLPGQELHAEAVAMMTLCAERASALEDLVGKRWLSRLPAAHSAAQAVLDGGIRAVDYLRAQRLRAKLRRAYEAFFDRFDAIWMPAGRPWGLETWASPSPKGLTQDPVGAAGAVLGLPSVAIPGPAVRGLPTGSVLTASSGSDGTLERVARGLQRRTGWHRQRPALRL